MNKFTTTLAGLALVAGASIAPAFAQGTITSPASFTTPGPFVFSFAPSTFSVINQAATYNPLSTSTMPLTGLLSLTGGKEVGTSNFYTNTLLTFTSGSTTFTEDSFTSIVSQNPLTGLYTITNAGTQPSGDTYVLANGAPVPEASTVISFGALLALGGLAVLRRKSVAKNAA